MIKLLLFVLCIVFCLILLISNYEVLYVGKIGAIVECNELPNNIDDINDVKKIYYHITDSETIVYFQDGYDVHIRNFKYKEYNGEDVFRLCKASFINYYWIEKVNQ